MESGSQCVSELNQFAQKNKLKPPVYEDLGSSGPDHMKVFKMRVRFDGEVFPEGEGGNKKKAKHHAAKNAFEILMKRRQEPAAASKEPAGQDENNASGRTGEEDELCDNISKLRVSKVDCLTQKVDYVSMINKHCQIKKLTPNYIEVDREGPSHNLEFSYRLELNKQLYPVGKANKKKDAQQMAAQFAYLVLREQPDWDSKMSVGSAVSEDEASEIASTSAIPSSLLEPELSTQSNQSSGSGWIQFKGSSKPSDVQGSSSVQDTGPEKNCENGLTSSSELPRFESDFDDIKPLGKGSYGCVYKARHKVANKYHAIKEIRSKNLTTTLREVLVLANLDPHPNIVRYYNSWLQDTGYNSEVKINTKFLFIEMELCEGGTLRRWICKKNKEPAENSRRRQSLEFARQILSGVEYIHSKKLIHRDLKPENILFGQDGNVRIGDFGLATQDNDDGELVERTEDSGTRSYMAPEQVGVNYDRKVDVFALGLIFFELFWRIGTGHERMKIWADVICQNLPKEFTETYPIESHIIKAMLSKKPEARPEASALKTELKRWTGSPEGNTDRGNLTV